MGDGAGAGDGVVRAAEALLWANGGRAVLLRLPAPAVPGDAAEELGLATPEFQDAVLQPVVFRKAESAATLLVSAGAVKALAGTLGFDGAAVLVETAAGVVVDGVLYGIEAMVASQAKGEAYCYSLTLRAPWL